MKSYYKPTPVKWRKIGDSLLAASTFIAGSGILTGDKTVAIIALCVGVVGKFLTNFFSHDSSGKG